MKALVVGWFSFENSDATAGDLLASDLVCEWLESAGFEYEVAHASPFPGGVNLQRVDPAAYTHAVFVCGPFMPNPFEAEFLGRFAESFVVGVNVSLPVPLVTWNPFDLLIERDSSEQARPDITFLSASPQVPVVGVCLVEPFADALVPEANAAVDRLVTSREMAVVRIDTRLDVNTTGLRTKREVEALLARMDAVITTRLHGTVLAMKHGVPPVVIDPELGGGRISRQCETTGWPCCFRMDSLDEQALANAFDYCLTSEARRQARECSTRAVAAVADVRTHFIGRLTGTQPPGPKRDERRAFASSYGWPTP